MSDSDEIDLASLFGKYQKFMLASLDVSGELSHPVSKGDSTELDWRGWLSSNLPNRYAVARAVIIDSKGKKSHSIDLVIYDRQYTPLMIEHNGEKHIPAESVYAAFEIKQNMNKKHIEYAQAKIASVRKLHRTSATIYHAGGKFEPKVPIPILGGFMTTYSDWSPPFGESLLKALEDSDELSRLDLCCSLADGTFEVNYEEEPLKLEITEKNKALLFFFLKLLSKLQKVGTVAAIDYNKYGENLI